jgi:hypothetical protein
MIARLTSLCLAASLLSCAPAQRLPDADLADERGWIFMDQLKMVAFAAPDPRDYAVIVACEGEEALRFYHRTLRPEELTDAPSLTLQSGRHVLTLPGERQDERATPPPVAVAPDGEITGVTIMAVAPRNAPVVENFLATGDLQLRSGARITRADAAPNETAALRALWDRCA